MTVGTMMTDIGLIRATHARSSHLQPCTFRIPYTPIHLHTAGLTFVTYSENFGSQLSYNSYDFGYYHSDDGYVYYGRGTGVYKLPPFGAGDTVGSLAPGWGPNLTSRG